jgi:hypothetical protein
MPPVSRGWRREPYDRTAAPTRNRAVRGYAAWALAGFLATFAILTGFSIGFLVAPFAVVAVGLALRHTARDAEVSGMVLGAGATLAFIGLLNLDRGGMDPAPWLFAGAALAAISVALYSAARR